MYFCRNKHFNIKKDLCCTFNGIIINSNNDQAHASNWVFTPPKLISGVQFSRHQPKTESFTCQFILAVKTFLSH